MTTALAICFKKDKRERGGEKVTSNKSQFPKSQSHMVFLVFIWKTSKQSLTQLRDMESSEEDEDFPSIENVTPQSKIDSLYQSDSEKVGFFVPFVYSLI